MPPVYTPRSPLPSGQGGAGQENRAARRDLAGQQYTNDFSDLLQGLQAHSRALDGAAGAEAVRSGGSVRAPWEGLGTPSRPSWEQAASARSPSNPAQLHAGGGAGLDQGWGDPAAHLVTYQPTQRPRGIDETMKELYRRAPWNNQTREGKDG
jgi:hypothetical protein